MTQSGRRATVTLYCSPSPPECLAWASTATKTSPQTAAPAGPAAATDKNPTITATRGSPPPPRTVSGPHELPIRWAQLARTLAGKGALTDPLWHRAILAVDRTRFLPEMIYGPDPAHPGWECPITRADPRWPHWVSGDYALVTQVDDGNPTGSEDRGDGADASGLPCPGAGVLSQTARFPSGIAFRPNAGLHTGG